MSDEKINTDAFKNLERLKELRLTDEWRRYRVEIGDDVDMQRIKTGFFWSLAGQGGPTTFYLDDIRYVDAVAKP